VSEALFSPSWYRVNQLTPRMRAHAQIYRHQYRGETWYVLRDSANERFHRFTPASNFVIALMDGQKTVEQLWAAAVDELGDDAPTQGEMISLMGQLHAADVLQCDVPPDAAELFDRWQKHERQQLKGRLMSPFSIRVPLVDPERFLARTLPLVRPLLGWGGAVLWLAVVLPALVLAGLHWDALTDNLLDRVITPANLAVVWLVFPLLKGLHELGHGYAAKAFGGEVHDMGIMFLIFTPVPYVDASSSWAFRSKVQRAGVAAGGMIVELFIAALALYVWVGAEPGIVRAIAYNTLIIGGVTTLFFNANPLLRFDGYYIFSDWLEIPNLRGRANKYFGWLVERYLFGNRDAEAQPTAPGEPGWFVFYSVSAFLYRMLIVVAILSWVLDQFFFIGVVLGAFAAFGWLGMPLYKGLKQLFAGTSLRRVRGRALGVVGGGIAVLVVLLSLVPMPLRTIAEGVVWIPEEAFVRPESEGFIDRVASAPGARIEPGDLLFALRNPELGAEVQRLDGRVRELEARYAAQRGEDLVEAEMTNEELQYVRSRLERAREKAADLEIRSAVAGRFVLPRDRDLPGRFVSQGEVLGYVVDLETIRVRAVVSQDDLDLVAHQLEGVEVRMAERLAVTEPARVKRIVPAASDRLPSIALGSEGGGAVASDPRERSGDVAMQSMFEVELELPSTAALVKAGGRVYVRFDHGTEPLFFQGYRRVRQVFLSRFRI
jgi:putative peptide zinc metalloprotease protein